MADASAEGDAKRTQRPQPHKSMSKLSAREELKQEMRTRSMKRGADGAGSLHGSAAKSGGGDDRADARSASSAKSGKSNGGGSTYSVRGRHLLGRLRLA